MNFSRNDIPTPSAAEDRLDRTQLIENLVRVLVHDDGGGRRASRVIAGLTGEWGSGKSSVLRQLSEKLGTLANVAVVEFNPWIFQGRDDLLDAFFDEMRAQLGSSRLENVGSIVKALDRYRDAIEPIAESIIPGAGLAAKAIPHLKRKSALDQRRILEKKLNAFDGAVVVLIDDLDRVEDDEVRAMARLIKAVGDLPNMSYLVAFDRGRVERALGNGKESDGARYLQKIVQFSIPLRPLMDYEAQSLLEEQLLERGYDPNLGDSELMSSFLNVLLPFISTPRDVKRLVSSFDALEPMVRGELHSVDILGYATLCSQAASIRDKIAGDIDSVVNDPQSSKVAIARLAEKATPSLESVFEVGVDQKLAGLIRFLFPALGGKVDQDRFGRIQNRINLLTMLYLDNPPFRVSRKQVEDFWSAPTVQKLREIRDRERLSDFFGQISKLMTMLSSDGDVAAFEAISGELGRGPAQVRSEGAAISNSVRDILISVAERGFDERRRVIAIVNALIAADDLVIVPKIVRYHMFAHGLVSSTRGQGGLTIFDKSQTQSLLRSELPRYRAYIEDGRWLSDTADVSPLYALEQGGAWDASLRAIAEKQLDMPGAVESFAALFTPPGWSIEPKTVERFVSEADLASKLSCLPMPPDKWLAMCVTRLKKSVEGKDVDFPD